MHSSQHSAPGRNGRRSRGRNRSRALCRSELGLRPAELLAAPRRERSIMPSEVEGYPLPHSDYSCGSPTGGNLGGNSAVTVNTPGVVTISATYIQHGSSLPLKSGTVRVVGKARPVGADGW